MSKSLSDKKISIKASFFAKMPIFCNKYIDLCAFLYIFIIENVLQIFYSTISTIDCSDYNCLFPFYSPVSIGI